MSDSLKNDVLKAANDAQAKPGSTVTVPEKQFNEPAISRYTVNGEKGFSSPQTLNENASTGKKKP